MLFLWSLTCFGAGTTTSTDAASRQMRHFTGGGKPEDDSSFHLTVAGQIESGQFDGAERLYCKCGFTFGTSWSVVQVGLHWVVAAYGVGQLAMGRGGVVWHGLVSIYIANLVFDGCPLRGRVPCHRVST